MSDKYCRKLRNRLAHRRFGHNFGQCATRSKGLIAGNPVVRNEHAVGNSDVSVQGLTYLVFSVSCDRAEQTAPESIDHDVYARIGNDLAEIGEGTDESL
jgi:hypothetical protein